MRRSGQRRRDSAIADRPSGPGSDRSRDEQVERRVEEEQLARRAGLADDRDRLVAAEKRHERATNDHVIFEEHDARLHDRGCSDASTAMAWAIFRNRQLCTVLSSDRRCKGAARALTKRTWGIHRLSERRRISRRRGGCASIAGGGCGTCSTARSSARGVAARVRAGGGVAALQPARARRGQLGLPVADDAGRAARRRSPRRDVSAAAAAARAIMALETSSDRTIRSRRLGDQGTQVFGRYKKGCGDLSRPLAIPSLTCYRGCRTRATRRRGS